MGFMTFDEGHVKRSWAQVMLTSIVVVWTVAIAAGTTKTLGEPPYLFPLITGCIGFAASIVGLLYCIDCGVD